MADGVELSCDPPRPSLGGSCTLTLSYPDDETLESLSWSFHDADQRPVNVPTWSAGTTRPGFGRHDPIFQNQIGLVVPSEPTHAELKVTATATLTKDPGDGKPKSSRTVPVETFVSFEAFWGGIDRAQLPHPVDWVTPWGQDGPGRRALVLMYDLIIEQLPPEFREKAGAVPIVRVPKLPRNITGFHGPYISDAVVISEDVIERLDESKPEVTPHDIFFASTVLHELAHVVTYRQAPVDVHGALIELQKAMRKMAQELPGVPGLRLKPDLLMLAAWHGLLLPDFATGFAEAAHWELTSPMALLAYIGPPVALSNLLWLLPPGARPTVRPNMISGWSGIGWYFGLRNLKAGNAALADIAQQELDLSVGFRNAAVRLEKEVQAPGDPAKDPEKTLLADLKRAKDEAEGAWTAKKAELESALQGSEFVSSYAAADVLEDIAETVRVLVFGVQHLNEARPATPDVYQSPAWGARRYVETPGLAARQAYLMKEGLFPQGWKPMRVGQGLRGADAADHLDKWRAKP